MHVGTVIYLASVDTARGDAIENLCCGCNSTTFRIHQLDELRNLDSSGVACTILVADSAACLREHVGRFSPIDHPVIGLVWQADSTDAVELMRMGLWHLLIWPVGAEQLQSCLREAQREDALRLERRQRLASVTKKLAELAPGERQVLQLLMMGRTNKSVARELHVGQRTVEARRARMLNKLQAENMSELIHKIAGVHQESLLAEVLRVPPQAVH